MNELFTRCNWCMLVQTGNLTDVCNACKSSEHLMDYLEVK